jgi:prophage tail gpP-like protein
MGLLDSLTGSSNASSPAYRPAFKVGAAPSGGGGGGLLGGDSQRDPWADSVQALTLDLQLAPGVDICTIEAAGAGLPSVALGDSLSLQLGYDTQLTTVYTGQVVRIRAGQDNTVQLTLDNGALTLARLRQNTSFEQQTLNAIINKVLNDAGVQAGTVHTGPDFPFMALDDSQSLWAWITDLAAMSGAFAWVDGDGKVQLKPGGGSALATFTYGHDVLALQYQARMPVAAQVTVLGEGAAGSQGSQAWSWLSKQRSAIQAQQGSGASRQQSQAVLRNLSAVQGSAQGWLSQLTAQGERVRVTVPGNTDVQLAGTFSLSSCPQARGDGDYIATRIQHRYDKRTGFVTQLEGQRAGAAL